MRAGFLVLSVIALALSACGDGPDEADVAATNGEGKGNESGAIGNAAVLTAPAAPPTAESGQQYVDLAAAGDLYEIESARIALDRSANEGVRSLAEMILADHERSAAQLNSAARQADPPLTARPALDPQQENDLQALRAAAEGEAFDREFLMQQMRAHDRAIALATHYAVNGDVDALRRHASAASDPIRRHLSRIRDLVLEVS